MFIQVRAFSLAMLLACGLFAEDVNNATVNRLLDQIAAQEHAFVAGLRHYAPVAETYIQDNPQGTDFPSTGDHYFLGKLDLSNGVDFSSFTSRTKKEKRLWTALLPKRGGLVFSPKGFAQMIFPDENEFDRKHYEFTYVRREFLGDVRCFVFDVAPLDQTFTGKFVGRIWVEDSGNHLVRFNGTYTDSKPSRLYFHFDSWRTNTYGNEWLPTYIYIEESGGPKGVDLSFKAQTRLWGYKPANANKLDELTSILVESNSGIKDEAASKDVSPIESQRAWERHAEENVLERLERTGLLAPKGDVDNVLNTVVNNLLATNNLNLDVDCRVLLTTPMESFSLPHTIVVSRGLIDVLPDEGSLALVLANELAQIALGYTTQTRYAFQDQTMFTDEETLKRFRFQRGPDEMELAGKKAMDLLAASPYKDKLSGAVLFLRALNARAPRLPNLIQANLGNQLASGANLERMASIAKNAPQLNEQSLSQIAALPLGSRVKVDPYNGQIALVKAKPIALLSPREKMAFEVSPFMPHITRTAAIATRAAQRR